MEVGEVETFTATVGGAAGARGGACPVDTGLSGRTLLATCAAVVVVGLEIDAISAAYFLTSRTRGLADAVDTGLSGFAACST